VRGVREHFSKNRRIGTGRTLTPGISGILITNLLSPLASDRLLIKIENLEMFFVVGQIWKKLE
jgi:hypothetical protein